MRLVCKQWSSKLSAAIETAFNKNLFLDHYLVGITNTEPEKNNEFEVFIMDINTGRANTFAKVRSAKIRVNVFLSFILHASLFFSAAVRLGPVPFSKFLKSPAVAPLFLGLIKLEKTLIKNASG